MDEGQARGPPILGPPIVITRPSITELNTSKGRAFPDAASCKPGEGSSVPLQRNSPIERSRRDSLEVPGLSPRSRRSSLRSDGSVIPPRRSSSLRSRVGSQGLEEKSDPLDSTLEPTQKISDHVAAEGALLRLPPPPPFDLAVEGLSVGVPQSKASR